MNIKKITALLCAVVMVLSLAACGSNGDKAENKHYTVGICQLVQHDALDAATKGFRDAITDALGAENVTFDEQNAAGDSATCATICNTSPPASRTAGESRRRSTSRASAPR